MVYSQGSGSQEAANFSVFTVTNQPRRVMSGQGGASKSSQVITGQASFSKPSLTQSKSMEAAHGRDMASTACLVESASSPSIPACITSISASCISAPALVTSPPASSSASIPSSSIPKPGLQHRLGQRRSSNHRLTSRTPSWEPGKGFNTSVIYDKSSHLNK